MRLILLGCTGFIGQELVPRLLASGHRVTLVSRKNPKNLSASLNNINCNHLRLDPSKEGSWTDQALTNACKVCEGIINLTGEPIANKRWSNEHKKQLRNSRINTTKFLTNTLKKLKSSPKVLINASAIGYYGSSEENEFTENSTCGSDFLASLCEDWEMQAANKPKATKLIVLRIGLVIAQDGGIIGRMLPIFKAGLGGPIGNGKQWMSWIHRSDLCNIIEVSLNNKRWTGVVNCVAPHPIKMYELTNILGKQLNRPSFLPVPAIVLKLLLGDGAKIVLEGQKVKSEKLNGFKFQYSNIEDALIASTTRI